MKTWFSFKILNDIRASLTFKFKPVSKINSNNKLNLEMARDVGFEPTRPFDHRLSRPAPYQARAIPHYDVSFEHAKVWITIRVWRSDIFAFCIWPQTFCKKGFVSTLMEKIMQKQNMHNFRLHFFSLNFTFPHISSLYFTQPANETKPKPKKQTKTQRKNFCQKNVER